MIYCPTKHSVVLCVLFVCSRRLTECVLYANRNRRNGKHIYTGEVAYTESENVVLNPVAPQPYLGTFQPIPVSEFRNHVMKMHADSDYRFSEEYGVCVLCRVACENSVITIV